MRTPVRTLLATLACALPALAQGTVAEPRASDNTEKLWRIEVSGISGWGAASTAARISSILTKQKGIKDLVFDTTGIGYFKATKPLPVAEELNDLLSKQHVGQCKVSKLGEVDVPKAACVYEVQVAGLGWMATAIETRDVLSKMEGVIRVHPNGLNGKALVFVKDKKAVDAEKFKEAFKDSTKLSFRKMELKA